MRTMQSDGTVASTLTMKQLGKVDGYISINRYAPYRYDLKDQDSTRAYVAACEAAAEVPLLSQD